MPPPDVIAAMEAFASKPRPGAVYNMGGGRGNSASILECVSMIEGLTGEKMKTRYLDEPRRGDHICYISDLSRFQSDYPQWQIERSLEQIVETMVKTMSDAQAAQG